MKTNYHITKKTKIAEIGSGTGILTKQMIEFGCDTFAVEPNIEMRKIADRKLNQFNNYNSIAATAENTTLNSNSIVLIIVAQAFHWFNKEQFMNECHRIQKKMNIVLVWNTKNPEQPYIKDLEIVNKRYCKDFKGFSGGICEEEIRYFFNNKLSIYNFINDCELDYNGFQNAILTASYAPNENNENYKDYISEIQNIFIKHSTKNKIKILNNTIAYTNKNYCV